MCGGGSNLSQVVLRVPDHRARTMISYCLDEAVHHLRQSLTPDELLREGGVCQKYLAIINALNEAVLRGEVLVEEEDGITSILIAR